MRSASRSAARAWAWDGTGLGVGEGGLAGGERLAQSGDDAILLVLSAVERCHRNGGAGDVAAQVFQLLALMGGAAHLGMEAEALRVDAADGGQWRLCREGLQAQHFLARPRPERNAVGAGCRPQGPEREIRIGVGEIAHALLFDEEALARSSM